MSYVTDDLATILASAGVGTVGTSIYSGGRGLPDLPGGDPSGGIVAVCDSPASEPPVRAMGGSLAVPALERPRVQVLSRGATFVEARAKAAAVMNALDWLGPTTSSAGSIQNVEALQRPSFLLTLDQNNRYVFAANFTVTRYGTS